MLAETAWPAADRPRVYICGPSSFVEAVAETMVAQGYDPGRIRTERFGASGGSA
jgi:ferredoxin-NADP reductase